MATHARRPDDLGEPGSNANEAVSLWFALGFPIVTFVFWLTGMLLLHPWIGFACGLIVSFLVGSRLTANAYKDDRS
jgi:hypothetical protein